MEPVVAAEKQLQRMLDTDSWSTEEATWWSSKILQTHDRGRY